MLSYEVMNSIVKNNLNYKCVTMNTEIILNSNHNTTVMLYCNTKYQYKYYIQYSYNK